jgi:hypothetical protein
MKLMVVDPVMIISMMRMIRLVKLFFSFFHGFSFYVLKIEVSCFMPSDHSLVGNDQGKNL